MLCSKLHCKKVFELKLFSKVRPNRPISIFRFTSRAGRTLPARKENLIIDIGHFGRTVRVGGGLRQCPRLGHLSLPRTTLPGPVKLTVRRTRGPFSTSYETATPDVGVVEAPHQSEKATSASLSEARVLALPHPGCLIVSSPYVDRAVPHTQEI